jgi:hypothetical protein
MVEMKLRPTKFNLRLAALAMLVISLAIVVACIVLPLGPRPLPAGDSLLSSSAVNTPTTQSTDNQGDLTDLADISLSRPLVDVSPAIPSSNTANADTTMKLRLTGTIIEPMHTYAIFTDLAGKTEIKSVGDTAGGADISSINADSVTLKIAGRSMVLHTIKFQPLGGPGI